MSLKQLLLKEAEKTYSVTEKLFKRVNNNELEWKPDSGNNWMTTGQLLMHCSKDGSGKAVKGFVTGDWGMPPAGGSEDPQPEQELGLPPAEAYPAVNSVEEALTLLEEDKKLTIEYLNKVNEDELLLEEVTPPWGGEKDSLYHCLTLMITHLNQHKGQLFYYLKLMGKDVNTGDLWGEG